MTSKAHPDQTDGCTQNVSKTVEPEMSKERHTIQTTDVLWIPGNPARFSLLNQTVLPLLKAKTRLQNGSCPVYIKVHILAEPQM